MSYVLISVGGTGIGQGQRLKRQRQKRQRLTQRQMRQRMNESGNAREDSENLLATATLAGDGEPASPVRNSQTLVCPYMKSL